MPNLTACGPKWFALAWKWSLTTKTATTRNKKTLHSVLPHVAPFQYLEFTIWSLYFKKLCSGKNIPIIKKHSYDCSIHCTFVFSNNIFDNSNLYRPGDKNFGVAKRLRMLLMSGIKTTHIKEYVNEMLKSMKRKHFIDFICK